MTAHFLFKPSVQKTAAMKRYHAWTLERPCCVSCRYDDVTLHHVTSTRDGGRRSRSHWLVVPLRADLHQIIWDSKNSVEALNHGQFFERYGVDLLYAAAWNLAHYQETEGA